MTRAPFKRRFHSSMGDTRSRDTAHIRLSEDRKRLIEARLEQGIEGFTDWCRAQNVLAWPMTDQSIVLGLVLAKFGREARDAVRDAVF